MLSPGSPFAAHAALTKGGYRGAIEAVSNTVPPFFVHQIHPLPAPTSRAYISLYQRVLRHFHTRTAVPFERREYLPAILSEVLASIADSKAQAFPGRVHSGC
jgi:hypothetical protein